MALMLLPHGFIMRGLVVAGAATAGVGLTAGWEDAREFAGYIAEGVGGAAAVAREVIPSGFEVYRELSQDGVEGTGPSPEDTDPGHGTDDLNVPIPASVNP